MLRKLDSGRVIHANVPGDGAWPPHSPAPRRSAAVTNSASPERSGAGLSCPLFPPRQQCFDRMSCRGRRARHKHTGVWIREVEERKEVRLFWCYLCYGLDVTKQIGHDCLDACQVSAKPRVVRLGQGDFQLSLIGRSTADPQGMLVIFAGAILLKPSIVLILIMRQLINPGQPTISPSFTLSNEGRMEMGLGRSRADRGGQARVLGGQSQARCLQADR